MPQSANFFAFSAKTASKLMTIINTPEGYILGAFGAPGSGVIRDSKESFRTLEEAESALSSGEWTQYVYS